MKRVLTPSIARHLVKVCANIRALRRRAGLTQEELADAAGIDSELLARIERGATDFGVSVLVAIANALHVAPDELLAGSANALFGVRVVSRLDDHEP